MRAKHIAVPDIDIAALRVGSDGTECFAAVGGASRSTDADLRGLIAFSTDDVMSSLIEQDLNFLISPKSARLVSQLGPLFAAAARDDLEANELIALFDDLSFQRDALDYDALARCATERSIISVSSNLGDEFSELTCEILVPFEDQTTDSFVRTEVMVLTMVGERTFALYFPYLKFR